MTPPILVPMNDLKRRFAPLADDLKSVIAGVLESGSYILGPACAAFETAFATYCGTAHCVGVANGTDALELTLRAVGVKPGDRVATVANAGMYTSVAILAIGAKPVYVDVDAGDLTMSVKDLARVLESKKVAAVVATHLYGKMAAMADVLRVAGAVPVIEDCAQAHGAMRDGRRAGAWGKAGCFSFYPTKNLGALGDGGAVVTDDPDLAARLRALRQYGWDRKYHAATAGGRNSRLDEIQAAILLAMLPRLDGWNANRRGIVQQYRARLAAVDVRLPAIGNDLDHVAHLCVIRSKARERLRQALADAGIATDIHYPIPDYRQPAMASALDDLRSLPETEAATGEILTLPCFPEMTTEEIERVAAALARGLD